MKDQDKIVYVVIASYDYDGSELYFFTDEETLEIAMRSMVQTYDSVDVYQIYDGNIRSIEVQTTQVFHSLREGLEVDIESEMRFDCPDDLERNGRFV